MKAYSVSQINNYIAEIFKRDPYLGRICVKGEVSNLTYHKSGHIYFSLKDQGSVLDAAMWLSSRKQGLTFPMKEGDKVLVAGTIQVYAKGGNYKLIASQIEKEGLGDLYVRYEALKAALKAKGYFDPTAKKSIPRYATRIGVITAPTGAAVRDIIHVAKRRNPSIDIVLYPALVQGSEAAASVAEGIRRLDTMGLDTLIVGRGGGSMEDLWAFNEEVVAEAIFNCQTPIISAVGHETDTTLSDYVADLRAPTPSAAAELAVFEKEEILSQLKKKKEQMAREFAYSLSQKRQRLIDQERRLQLSSPQAKIRLLKDRLEQEKHRLSLLHPAEKIAQSRRELTERQLQMQRSMQWQLEQKRHRLALLGSRLEADSPIKKLASGYSYVADQNGKRVQDASQLALGDQLEIHLYRGKLEAQVTGIETEDRR